MNSTSIDWVGLEEVQEALRLLPANLQSSILRQFNREAARKLTIPALKSANPYSADTAKGFSIVNSKRDKTAIFVGATTEAFWLRFIESGTEGRETKNLGYYAKANPDAKRRYPAGINRGAISAKPFIESAIDSTIDEIIRYTAAKYGERIGSFLQRKLKSNERRIAKLM